MVMKIATTSAAEELMVVVVVVVVRIRGIIRLVVVKLELGVHVSRRVVKGGGIVGVLRNVVVVLKREERLGLKVVVVVMVMVVHIQIRLLE